MLRAARILAGTLCLLAILGGCATQTQTLLREPPAGLPRSVELAQTPFFPQEQYQCGPAALATTLRVAGIPVTPQELADQVFLPLRAGSLQTEMLAAGRRNGAFTVTIPPRLDALLAEVAAGNPVVVLQNLGLSWAPLWHYAVVIGYDLDGPSVILRSGTTERQLMALSTFEHTWRRSGSWGIVTLPPGTLPKTAEEGTAVTAAVAFEKGRDPALARRVYAAAVRRWPSSLLLQLGLGNTAYTMRDLPAAAEAFRAAATAHPDSAPAWNNLAVVLAELGRIEEARDAARQAVAIGGTFADAARETLKALDAAPAVPRRNGI